MNGRSDRKSRIGIFLPTLLGGGAEHAMVTLANGIAERDISVDLVVGQAIGPNRERLDSRVNLVEMGAPHVMQCIRPLARYLRAAKPDALLSAMTHTNNAALIARFLSRTTTRVVVSERTTIDWKPTSYREALHIRLRAILYRHADALILVAKEEIDEASRRFKLPKTQVVCIYNPIITPEFEESRSHPPDHPWLRDFSREKGPVIVAVGRLDPIKDYPNLLEAFALLLKRRSARLIVFGEGAQRDALATRIDALGIDESVSLAGYFRNPAKEMNASDLFVLSSRLEGLPGVLIQALGCGLRIVSTDCTTGPREILEDGKWGRLVPVGDVAALAAAMEQALAGGPPPECPSAHLDQFSLSHAVNAYLDRLLPVQGSQKAK